MELVQELSPTAQTAYAQLLDAAQATELARSLAQLRGSFAHKTVKGRRYWYFQFTEVSGRLRQVYVGPDSEPVRTLVETRSKARPALEPLARSAEALGCAPVLLPHFRVVQRLGDYGFFRAGGALVGTQAFVSFGNMLGVRWREPARTQDVDFAHAGKAIAIALPTDLEIDTHAAIESLEQGFLPLGSPKSKAAGSYLHPRDRDFQLDFLTPWHRGGARPFHHPQLGVVLQPLKFMEYLLEDVQQAALFCSAGACVVNLPHPARYALHKLIVFGERPAARAVKANKDLLQSAAILSVLRERGASQVDEAWADLVGRGSGWSIRARRGRNALARLAPELEVERWLAEPRPKRRRRPARR
jgi:hypothetical protein